jgi:Pyruvate/2-oxoacid:ferredoxin oxidoreductase delta subunit
METEGERSKEVHPHWRFRVILDRCIGCGVCMDTCPVSTLDMSRPTGPGVDGTGPYPWMTEQPVQVRQCIGCWVCRTECPTDAIAIEATDSEPQMQTLPPHTAGPRNDPDRGWIPLSALTRDSKLDPVVAERHGPWGDLAPWKMAPRGRLPWQVWRGWIRGARNRPAAEGKSRKEA